jgi:hypothetical protein
LETASAVPVEVVSTMTILAAASVGYAPDHREDPEDVAESVVLPEAGEVPAARGVRAHELQGEAEDERATGPQRGQAQQAEHRGGHRAFHQHQAGVAADQAEDRTDGNPGEHQGADRIQAPVPDEAAQHGHAG